MSEVILEASSYKRKYKCPYCDYRNTREKLIYHVDEKHDDMIPEGYTASRVVFNYVNGKEKGTCVCGCGRETMWNENICRYERFTDDPKCKQRYIDLVNQRKMKKYGTWNLAADPKFQEKMLSGRKISGTYKYSDGGERSYVGSYERKLHEFLDVVCKFESKHILSPGPIIEYTYKGEKHYYISDIFIIPYNLIIEVKDGGDNPNTRDMKEYREKQIAKEAQIVKDQEYNYVRVTNNQFDQLLTILAELKLQLVDDNYKKGEKIIRIYENAPLMVHYRSTDGIREGLYVAMDNYLQFVVTESGEVLSGDEALKDCTYDLYASDKRLTKEDIKECFKSDSKIYETFSGNKLYDYDQIKYDDNLTKVDDAWKSLDKEVNEMCRYIMHGNIDTTLDSLESLLEDVMVETSYKSKIKDDFKPKGKKSLNDFKKVKIDKSFIEKYTPNTKLLKEADMSEFGYGWIDKDDDLVGYCMCNDYGWITAVEVSPKYMGYGLGEQLLKYSMSNMGGNRLGVHDDNQVAIRLYKNMGFKEVPAKAINGSGEKNMIFMTTDKSILNSLKGINEFHYGTIKELKYDTITSSNPKYKTYLKRFNIVNDLDEVVRDYAGEILVSKDDELIGHVFVGDNKDKGFITDLVVEKKYRKLGFGKKLLDSAINKYGGADLTVSKTNKVAIDMYKKRGFVIDTSRNPGKYMHYMVLESRLNEGFQSGKIFVSEAMQNKKKEKKYYYLSRISMNDDRLEPKIPDNYLTQIGAEDNITPRVCLSTSIDGCLRALSRNLEGQELWVHVVDAYDKKKIKIPTTKEVPDAAITGEVWCLGAVDLRCIGKIRVEKARNPIEYEYKDENGDIQKAELYNWDWHWVAKNRYYVS